MFSSNLKLNNGKFFKGLKEMQANYFAVRLFYWNWLFIFKSPIMELMLMETKVKQAMITLQEMAVFNSLYMVHKWLSWFKKSVIAFVTQYEPTIKNCLRPKLGHPQYILKRNWNKWQNNYQIYWKTLR